MNCFEWQSRASDYLDCTLIGTAKRDADEHLDGCRACSEKYKHYRLILTAVAGQPRSSLPVPIRKAPLESVLPKRGRRERIKAHWKHLPWFMRSSLEGLAIVMIILLGISAGPKLRALYERGLEQSLSEFGEKAEPLSALEAANSGGPVNHGPIAPVPGAQFADGTLNPVQHPGDDFSASEGGDSGDSDAEADDSHADEGTGDSEEATVPSGPLASAGRAEIWRFNLKTDSPQEVRGKVAQILHDLKVNAQNIRGIEAPGGVQFDLLVAQAIIGELKQSLEKLSVEKASAAPAQESFTWYKSKSRKPIPSGKTRVVIWLSQL